MVVVGSVDSSSSGSGQLGSSRSEIKVILLQLQSDIVCLFVCLFDLILYVPSTIFQLNRDGSSWVEAVLS